MSSLNRFLDHISDKPLDPPVTLHERILFDVVLNILNHKPTTNLPPDFKIHASSRGIGRDRCPGCFVCNDGDVSRMMSNISMFVGSRQDGEMIVEMFPHHGARLDYRSNEPDWIQVKVGACDNHVPNLEKLDELIYRNEGLSCSMVAEAMAFHPEMPLVDGAS